MRAIFSFIIMFAMISGRYCSVFGFVGSRSIPRKSSSNLASYSSRQILTSPKRLPVYYSRGCTSLFMSTEAAPTSLVGIGYVQNAVLETLNELFDPAEVARGATLQKLNKGNNKKKKKKKKSAEDGEDSAPKEEPAMSEDEKMALANAAAKEAKPFTTSDTMVTPATKPEFGDYQVNAAMGLASSVGMNPRGCAQNIADSLQAKIGDIMETPEIAGPGFINLKFKQEYLTSAVSAMARDAEGRLGIPKTRNKQKIIVDFSSPNIAKEMHVGHLRSTIIGDTLCSILEFAGNEVLRLNHIGDWGTQFGMLVEHLRDEYPEALSLETSQNVDLGDLVELYKAAKKRFDDDDDFKVRAREGVVKLQAGDQEALTAWESLCAASRVEYQKVRRPIDVFSCDVHSVLIFAYTFLFVTDL
jgi:hypothetical protein